MSEDLKKLVAGIAGRMAEFHQSLEVRADELRDAGGDPDVVKKLKGGADAMRDSANIYLSWARHYVSLSQGQALESDEGEEDSPDFQF